MPAKVAVPSHSIEGNNLKMFPLLEFAICKQPKQKVEYKC